MLLHSLLEIIPDKMGVIIREPVEKGSLITREVAKANCPSDLFCTEYEEANVLMVLPCRNCMEVTIERR